MVLWKELGVVLFSIPCKQFLHDFHSLCFALLMSVFCLLSLLFLSPSLASRPLSFSVIFTPVDPHSFWHEAVKWDISQCDSQPAWQPASMTDSPALLLQWANSPCPCQWPAGAAGVCALSRLSICSSMSSAASLSRVPQHCAVHLQQVVEGGKPILCEVLSTREGAYQICHQ